ncbi:hypothetical protein GR211_22160 [Rhizobium leguminosarum]|uniref:hypothetical protein n=1 Tax=Rhizobium ruizarguesonis TaxID=2081791 RepID=UPI0013BCE23E|nr:hypothetical protein [Rhizobium ruizarguesonis]NEJ15525.1 hypothetical protein [Rhizobium ruizarguesonis]NEK29600.1 hypothetical protein [Rhizobium ruizarguesonis]
MMNDVKGILQSKTIWGLIIAALGTLLNKYGYEVSALDQAALVDQIALVMQVVGWLVAFYGRIRATKVIAPTQAVVK